MYQITALEDEIAVPPTKFALELEAAVRESIAEKFEGRIDPGIGVVLAVTDIDAIGEGRVLPGDPAVHYQVRFKVLSWMPREHEIVEGEIIDITEFGAFVRGGPLDGLVHISQVMDDFVSYDDKNAQLVGRTSRRVLKEGDAVKARIISISFKETTKVGLTMRQPLLGAIKWLAEKAKEEKRVRKEKKEEAK